MIPNQIILVKQANIHVYSIEVRYLSLMSIVSPLHARVYWPFQGDVSFVDLFFLLIYVFMFVSVILPSCLLLAALWSSSWCGWPLGSLLCGVLLCFCCLSMWYPGWDVVLGCISY